VLYRCGVSRKKTEATDVLARISQIVSPVLACDLRYTLEKQRCSAKACHADRGTQWVTAKTRICGSVLTAA